MIKKEGFKKPSFFVMARTEKLKRDRNQFPGGAAQKPSHDGTSFLASLPETFH